MDSTYFVVCTAYSAISIPIYLRIVYLLLRKPEFAKLPFYHLLCINGILDISHVLFTILFYEFPMFGPTKDWFPTGSSSRLISLVIVAHFATIYQLFFLHVAISFNRLTAIFWPFHHRVLWKRWWPAIPVGGALISVALTFHRIFAVSNFAPIDQGKCGYTPSIKTYDFYQFNQNLVTAALGLLCLLVCLACNGATLWLILRKNGQMRMRSQQQQQQQQSAQQRNAFRSEVRMYFIAFWMCIFMVIFIGRQLLTYARSEGLLAALVPWATSGQVACFVFSQIPWSEAVFSLSQPWVLLLANKQVRQSVLPAASWLQCFGRKMPEMTTKALSLQPQQQQQLHHHSRQQRGRSVFVVSSSITTTMLTGAQTTGMPLSARGGGGGSWSHGMP